MFLDSGSHMLDAILWMTGMQPESISAQIENRDTLVDINAAVSLRAANGVLATITICGDAPNWHEEIVVWCDRGAFFIRNGQLTVHEADGSRFEAGELKGGTTPDQAFVATILGNIPNPTAFEDGLKVMCLTQAAYDSAASGGSPVRL
jgi:predicted dehydrogenase